MESEKARLRRYENELHISGLGVVVFGIWSVLKTIIQIFMNPDELGIDLKDVFSNFVAWITVIVIVAIFCLVITAFHLYIGINASRAARGKNYKKGYVVATVIVLLINVLSMYAYKDSFQDTKNIETNIASFLVDITSVYVFFVILRSTFVIKKLRKASRRSG